MIRTMLAAIAVAMLAVCGETAASPGLSDRTFTGNHEWLTGVETGFEIENRPAQQIAIETRFLVSDSAALGELGVSPVITGVTLFTTQPDGSTGVHRTPVDASTGMVRIGGFFDLVDGVAPTSSEPVGLGFLFGDQLLIDVRMGDAAAYDPTAIDSDASLNDKFQTEIAGISESGFGMPRTIIRDLPTQVLISDGTTIVMGFEPGLREYREKTEIPLLGEVPILGRLFVGHITEARNRALIIHITPTIIDADTE